MDVWNYSLTINDPEFNKQKSDKLNQIRTLIIKYGMREAEEMWSEQNQPHKMFLKAKKLFEWQKNMWQQKQNRLDAEKTIKTFYPWQQFLREELMKKPDDRTVWVVLDKNAPNGKTFFQKTMMHENPGKVVKLPYNLTKTHLDAIGNQSRTLFIDVPWETNKFKLATIQNIKDGYVVRRTKPGRIDPLHVVLFSNKPLCWKNLAEDRWKILHITAEPNMAWQDNVFKILTLSEYIYSFTQDK
jgi:hypothetical protein